MAETKSTAAGAATDTKALNPEIDTPVSSGEPIDSVAIRNFYDSELRTIQEGTRYLYTPVEDLPYPYANLRPVDPALGESLKAEFTSFKKEKQREIERRTSLKAMMTRAAQMDD